MQLPILGFISLCLGTAVLALPQSQSQSRSTCTSATESIREEWGSLSKAQRLDYINAVQCMLQSPPLLDQTQYPGVKNRMDDFVAVHINYTLSIHESGIFLAWHRNFVYLWEQALRDECGYKGYQPYWDWPLWASDLEASPLFDGSETSLSGNGAFNGTVIPVNLGEYDLPGGTGGGCVTSGPFKNLTLNLGPFDFGLAFGTSIPEDAFEYNPRCFSRNLNDYVASLYNNQTDVDNVLAASDIIEFQTLMGGSPPTLGNLGVHGGGHCTIGTTMQDFFASPADPAFMVFHGQIDRLWTLWQAADPATRRYAINGSSTIWYAPTTPEVTLDTVLEFNVLGPQRTMLELMSPTEYEFCYQYS